MAIDCLNRLESYWLKSRLDSLRNELITKSSDEQESKLVEEINNIQCKLNSI